jgi:hypothetical protein
MGWWRALSGTMRTRRTGRIDLPEADRLVAGDPPGPGHPGLSVLLAAVRAPAFAEELAGEPAAVAGFTAARRDAEPTMPGRRRVRVPLSARMVAVKVASSAAVLMAGGTAFAAETGHLPAGVQRHAHSMFSSLGVPASGTGTRPSGTGPGGTAGSIRPQATPSTGATPGTADPSGAVALELCQAWDAAQKPHGKAVPPESRKALATLAGGEPRIATFCATLLGRAQATNSPAPAATPNHPGNNGNSGNGNGANNGNGGNKPHAHPSHSPHH